MRYLFALFFLFLCLVSFFKIFAQNTDYISLSGGVFDFLRDRHRTAEFRVEYKPSFDLQTIRPIFGAMATIKGSFYLYGGVCLEFFFTKNLFFSPNLAAGFYYKGKGKDLGFPLEFRSGAELGWQFANLSRISAHICHISNASLGKRNPGVECLVLSYSMPLEFFFKKYR